MSNVLRLAIVDPNDGSREALKTMLMGLEMIWLEAEASRYEFFADVVAQTNPDIGVVAIDANPDKAIELVGRLSRIRPNAPCSPPLVQRRQLILKAMPGPRSSSPPIRLEDCSPHGRIGERHSARATQNPRLPGVRRGATGSRQYALPHPALWPGMRRSVVRRPRSESRRRRRSRTRFLTIPSST